MSERRLILVVDDEPQIQRFLGHALAAAGYDTCLAASGAEALAQVAALAPDLVILDLGLPDMNGKEVIERLRLRWDLPVIVLSAHDQEMEKIMALDLGADDFVAKPFGIGELLARLRASLRPRRAARAEQIRQGGLLVDLAAHQVSRDGEALRLTPKEFDLLAALAGNAGRVMTHRRLLQLVWGPAHVDDVPYLRVFVGQLRQKLEHDPARPELILTEPGIGYRWAAPEPGPADPGAPG
ncbi:two-component system, OmpR family, KDP operon response regulator KdpE [Paracoccus aminovorans]|uniref:Two-component system, OmpR family, KDP operon response regulator KdpE n=1 Tax=Paracoccus aminovorans TaxID=34004 RepID=A0A1I2Z6F5_9RHOB|nr:response regulator transcription factor [Paracoccus aminovorans]CQR83996.1 response regulator [Paracoccus aminovorans]SFH33066.1 two-component system, OmpR family, KDP operon response regulator KdpE [Paracoccus aminovorans]